MSICRLSRPSCRFQNRVEAYSMVSRSWLMRRVLSGQRGGSPVEIGEMLLVFEARHDIVGLRLEIDAHDAPLRRGVEERQPRAGDEIVHERGDEHRLARAREPGDAELQRRRDEAAGEVADAAEGIARGLAVGGNRHDSKRPLRSCPSATYHRSPAKALPKKRAQSMAPKYDGIAMFPLSVLRAFVKRRLAS